MTTSSSAVRDGMVAAISGFLELVTGTPAHEDERLPKLAAALDRLAWQYHAVPDLGLDDSDLNTPSLGHEEYKRVYALACGSFPDFGYYQDVDPDEGLDQELMVADAIDDLADIVLDLRGVLWQLENVGEKNAFWEFRFGYQSHWGRHLLSLRQYIHLRAYG